MTTFPRPGDAAPHFEGRTAEGERLALGDFRGRKLVLYFYPRDDTPGCTRQACSLRDHGARIAAKGAAVVGVSLQDAASHRAFAARHRLDFPLLADTDARIARSYGAIGTGWGGWLRAALGAARRVTFVIDENGRIAHVIRRPDVAHHAEEVLDLL